MAFVGIAVLAGQLVSRVCVNLVLTWKMKDQIRNKICHSRTNAFHDLVYKIWRYYQHIRDAAQFKTYTSSYVHTLQYTSFVSFYLQQFDFHVCQYIISTINKFNYR